MEYDEQAIFTLAAKVKSIDKTTLLTDHQTNNKLDLTTGETHGTSRHLYLSQAQKKTPNVSYFL